MAEKEKRKPLLIDFARAQAAKYGGNQFGKFTSIVERAKIFALDEKAVEFLGEYIRDYPERIAMANEFAIPPFETMWIEFNARLLFEVVNGRPLDTTGDERLAFLFHKGEVLTFAQGSYVTTAGDVAVSPVYYRLNRPATVEEELEMARLFAVSRAQLSPFMWGTPGVQIRLKNPEVYDVFRANHAVLPLVPMPDQADGQFSQIYEGAAGDLRNLIALLIFLNRTQDVQVVTEKKAKPGLIMRKPRSYIGHSVISLKLNPVERLKRIGTSGVSSPKRRHDVRGHYARNKIAKQAEEVGDTCEGLNRDVDPLFFLSCHDWKEIEGSGHVDNYGMIASWLCAKCKGRLWHKPEHRRGTLEKGAVVQQYAVSAS